jgi:hypothetical protein
MKKKATTIEEGSCSRNAHDKNVLVRRAQSRPSSTVSPRGIEEEVGLFDVMLLAIERIVAERFKAGDCTHDIVLQYGLTVEAVEYMIRCALARRAVK